MAQNVRFLIATQAKYDQLVKKNEYALYFCLDTQRLYKGDVLIGVGAEATTSAAGLLSAADKAKLDALVAGSTVGLSPINPSIVITDETDGTKKIAVGISKKEGNLITVESDGLYAVAQPTPSYEIEKQEVATDGYSATYKLKKTVGDVASYCGTINIPKDKFLQSATINTVTETDNPYTGAVVGEKYFDFLFNDAEQSHEYVPLKELVSTQAYTAGDGIQISDANVISMALATETTPGAISAEDFKTLQTIPSTYITKEEIEAVKAEIKQDVEATVGTPDASQFAVDENGVLSITELASDKITHNGQKLNEILDGMTDTFSWGTLSEEVSVDTNSVNATSLISNASADAEITLNEGTVNAPC
nr:MAG TPA: hypothetical protein [Caudoviricetes sp.]